MSMNVTANAEDVHMHDLTPKRLEEKPYSTDDARWQAVIERDKQADGQFFYAISTTGIYCYTSCPSRLALRSNTHFFESSKAAEQAGFRPCKRCKSDQDTPQNRDAHLIAQACRLIENVAEIPSLETLAQSQNLSRYHFHRLFKSITNVTPRAYAIAHRAHKIRTGLTPQTSITDAIYQAGFNSSGRFYATSTAVLGMTATHFKNGGCSETLYYSIGACSFGSILVARSEKGICAILIHDDDQPLLADLQKRFPKATLIEDQDDFKHWLAQIVHFVEEPKKGLELPLDIRGTLFQQRVWQRLQKIPLGTTASYTDIATQLGDPKAVRAVASACAANPIALLVPCHRVVRSDGAISGYRWGVENKRMLIAREAKAVAE
jgi:AraC family transcriptional regulator of adaptative response/methylated-DNA-[protein]-cysteine methyltransferase